MKKKRILILILQIVIVLGSLFMLMNYTNNRIKPTEVFIYNTNIDDITRPLTAKDIKKVTVPAEAISKNFIKDESEIIGKHVDGKVSAGQYIYNNQLISYEDVDVFKNLDMSKYRKISLPITYEEAFAGNLKRGDLLDLMYIGKGSKDPIDENDTGGPFTYSKVFMQDVLVYSVNDADGYQYLDRSSRLAGYDENKEEISTDVGSSGDLAIVTFAVTLEQAEQIEARANTGHIRFVGRFEESVSYNTLGYVMGDYGKVFSGQGFAETDDLRIQEDDFDEIFIEIEEEETEEEEEDKEETETEEEKEDKNKKDKKKGN